MGILYLVSTPIGNLEDITFRAVEVLFSVDLILCEDTRRTGHLLEWLRSQKERLANSENKVELLSYTDYTREKRMDEVLARLAKGRNVALVSNAGTPLLSDPGYKLVQEVIELAEDFDVTVESIPGANAILPALQLSGLPPDKFIFLGFLPRSSKQRHDLLRSLKNLELPIKTAICFESPYRLKHSLVDIGKVLGEVQIAVCRELTKMYEEIFRGNVTESVTYFEEKSIKGEITLVFRIDCVNNS